jgi:VWFA-related protein
MIDLGEDCDDGRTMVRLGSGLAAMLLSFQLAATPLAEPLASQARNGAAGSDGADGSGPARQNSASQGPELQSPVFQLDVRRVPVDVVVTDKKGNPVRGLSKDDFVVAENGVPQTVLSFDYFDGSQPSFVPPKLPDLPANTFVNLPAEPEQGPLYVIYYDMVNTPMEDQMSAHKQLLDFVDNSPPGTRFALFVNASGMHLVQGFTSDRALLHEAIVSKGPGPHLPPVFLYGSTFGSRDAGAALSNLKFLAEYLGGIPGRKNLLWISSMFPIPVGPSRVGNGLVSGAMGTRTAAGPEFLDLSELLKESIRKTYSAMMASQIALYPIDLKGIESEDVPGNAIIDHQNLDVIAASTGGHAYYGNNRLQVLMDKAVEDGESYYTISYEPSNVNFDGSPRHIGITLSNEASGLYTLTYRTVYYPGSDHERPAQPKHTNDVLQARFLAAKAEDTLYANIEHGAPMLHDLLFSVHLATVGTPVMATARQMAELQDSPAYFRTRQKNRPVQPLAPVKLQKYVIDYGVIDPRLKALAMSVGRPATLEFAAAAYDADGRLLNSQLNEGQAPSGIGPGAKPGAKAGALFHAEQQLEVPPGAAWIRLAVRDKLDNRTGTLEARLPLKPGPVSASSGKAN